MKRHLWTIALAIISILAVGVISMAADSGRETMPNKTLKERIMTAESIAASFTKAKVALVDHDYAQAAAEIRKVEDTLTAAAEDSSGDVKTSLQNSSADLEKLAKQVESGAVTDVKYLDSDFASAHNSVARYHVSRANRSMASKDFSAAGSEMKEAAANFKESLKLMGRATDTAVVTDSNDVANRMVSGKNWTEHEASHALKSLEKAIDDLGNDIRK